ncbi:MAG: hypothetical protein ABSC53_05930 [Bacteroidota bacterium]
MIDFVVDATIIGMSNVEMVAPETNSRFVRLVAVLDQIANGNDHARYNSRLLSEYEQLTKIHRNDIIDMFFNLLEPPHSVFVNRNRLERHHYVVAVDKCGWPSHDQHLLAAAIGGSNPLILVTEPILANCGQKILRHFKIHVDHVN